jgi:hypothetical protein
MLIAFMLVSLPWLDPIRDLSIFINEATRATDCFQRTRIQYPDPTHRSCGWALHPRGIQRYFCYNFSGAVQTGGERKAVNGSTIRKSAVGPTARRARCAAWLLVWMFTSVPTIALLKTHVPEFM